MFKIAKKSQVTRDVFTFLAEMVEYPTQELVQRLPANLDELAAQSARAARQLARFETFAASVSLGELEELYTSTFDLKPVCYPYVGYQLFGDTYKRGAFLAELNVRYREHGFEMGIGELPDHLGIILRYLAHTRDSELVKEGMIPTLSRMIEQLQDNPYRDVLRAVLTVVQDQ